jgi:hypothetical protein
MTRPNLNCLENDFMGVLSCTASVEQKEVDIEVDIYVGVANGRRFTWRSHKTLCTI